jgi:hypothetical protein
MDVSTWLRCLRMRGYVRAFQANHIDAEACPRLTAAHLTALRITSPPQTARRHRRAPGQRCADVSNCRAQ